MPIPAGCSGRAAVEQSEFLVGRMVLPVLAQPQPSRPLPYAGTSRRIAGGMSQQGKQHQLHGRFLTGAPNSYQAAM